MLIMGTSLKVHGLKVMIKEFAKAIHTRGGKVVFINRTKPPESTWGDVIDYWVEWDCDAWVLNLKERREDIWLPQGARLEERDSSDDAKPALQASRNKPSRPQCIRDDKMNGVFVTFKILDTLGRFTDSEGKPASRFAYFDKPAPRVSLPVQVEPVKKPAAKARKSLPAPTKGKSTTTSKKRKSCPSDLQKVQDQLAKREEELKQKMMAQWAEIRHRFPALPVLPRIRDPLKEIDSNSVDMSGYHWSFHNHKNHFPDLGWPSHKSMLLSHPPSGAELPLHHSPKKVIQAPPPAFAPPVQPYSRPTNHAYKTRSSRRISNADTIVVDDSETRPPTWSAEEDTIVVAMDERDDSKNRLPTPPESGTRTPTSQSSRIKTQSSISAILSDPPSDVSSEGVFYDAQEQMI
jgi:NAD-dependent histone deacetylase SIR2